MQLRVLPTPGCSRPPDAPEQPRHPGHPVRQKAGDATNNESFLLRRFIENVIFVCNGLPPGSSIASGNRAGPCWPELLPTLTAALLFLTSAARPASEPADVRISAMLDSARHCESSGKEEVAMAWYARAERLAPEAESDTLKGRLYAAVARLYDRVLLDASCAGPYYERAANRFCTAAIRRDS